MQEKSLFDIAKIYLSNKIIGLVDLYKKDPKFFICIGLVLLILIQQERIIFAIAEHGYYQPTTIDVNVENTPDVRIVN